MMKGWKTKNHLKMNNMSSRPEIPEKLGTQLQYQIKQIRSPSSKYKNKIMGTSTSERNLQFSRQVISPTMGCYR